MVYYFGCEGITESFTSKFSIFFIIIGIGVNINIIYLMIELRVTADKLGSTIVIIITAEDESKSVVTTIPTSRLLNVLDVNFCIQLLALSPIID